MLASWLLIPLCGLLSMTLAWRLAKAVSPKRLDVPNQRSSHSSPTPTAGGLAILLAFSAYLLALIVLGSAPWPGALILLCGGGTIGLLGYCDDRHGVAAAARLLMHLLIAACAVLWLEHRHMLPELPGLGASEGAVVVTLYVLGLVWLLNLFNFMDGIDGIAAQETIFAALGAAAILCFAGSLTYVPLLLALAAAAMGFALYNWPPARLFMGDTGSGFLGLVLGLCALLTGAPPWGAPATISLWSWSILLAVFVSDASVTLIRRLLRGEKIYQAHRSHAYQILARRWSSHRRVTLSVLAVNLGWLLPLAVLASIIGHGAWLALLAYLPLLLLAYRLGAGTTND